ncbi:proteasome inhibitor PI31 subunit [Lutzomyia longipalpis]|uniref:proteasome inhibitor PI31 subunit n=1 Tax=Lutzomyia longipalpis TaxID=7200 RepID=UPI002483DB17|nr:proteasome inhibitor PI31 subunit [Lutzomyia longipalpis]
MDGDYFGWNLLLRTIAHDVQSDFDILVAVVHWHMTRKGFSCLGIGCDNIYVDTDKGSELLPDDWNAQGDVYRLRYVRDGELFILTAVKKEEMVALFNLIIMKNMDLRNVEFKVEDTVRGRTGSLTEVLNDAPNVLKKIDEKLLISKAEQDSWKAKEKARRERHDLDDEQSSPLEVRGFDVHRRFPENPFSVGRGDLDPLGRLGGGMLFPSPDMPFAGGIPDPGFGIPGGLPRGAVPPGARFDPFAPQPTNPLRGPGGGRPRGGSPDNDHFPPPGYNDMFM